ncbi:MAG: hypothetical protein O2894_13075 [Planctomycetota bacterium]|nr:hypothetical protein [Planctomycetota bacterium]
MPFRTALLACLLLPCILVAGLSGPAPCCADADAEEAGFDPRFREGAPSDLLVEGSPHLARGHLYAFLDLFESAFDMALPGDTAVALRVALEERFRSAGAERRERFLALADMIVEMRRCARCCNDRGVRGCLRAFRQTLDGHLQAEPDDPAHRIMRHVLERRHVVVWLGIPEVKDLSAQAYLETVVFLASLGRGEALQLSPGQFSALRDYLDRDLRRLPEELRDRLARSHESWLLTKARWDRGPEERRLGLGHEAVRLMARLVPKSGGHEVGAVTDREAYLREAARVRAADRGFDAVTTLARNPEMLLEVLDRALGLRDDVPHFTFMYR